MRNKVHERRRNTISKVPVQDRSAPLYRFYIGPGNNYSLIRRVLSTRRNWEEITDSKFLFTNFKWQQTNRGFNYDNCVDTKVFKHCLNHLEFHNELSNKQNLVKNLTDYCESIKMNVFSFVPVTYTLNLADSSFDLIQNQFLKFHQLHLPQKFKKMERKQWLNITKRRHGSSIDRRANYYYCKPQLQPSFIAQNSQYLWLLKPSFYNRGKGIHVFNDIQTLEDLMKSYMEDNSAQKMIRSSLESPPSLQQSKKKTFRIRELNNSVCTHSFVVQKYLQRPLLVDGRKFDIRVWVLFTHELKVHFYKQGYIRTSSTAYSLEQKHFDDPKIHLTNNAIQKNTEQYGKYEDGNQLSFKFMSNYISKKGGNFQAIISQMKKIVKITAMAVRKKINKVNRQWCFELFGYDFMIDENFRVWLIEVNTNPCLEESSLLLENLIPRMIDDTMKLTIDQIFKGGDEGNKTNYVLQNYENESNLWEQIIDLKRNH